MIKEVFLLWHAYVSKELLLIGILRREEKGYSFEYCKDAVTAMGLGCFLPFPYTQNKLYFDTLPSFFAQRILTGDYNVNKFNVSSLDELELLTHYDGVKNSDNFSVVSTYNDIKKMNEANVVEGKSILRSK